MRKRTLFEKYCCEVSTFTVLTVLSLAYYTARYYRESKSLNPEASLSEKQRIRYWDWPDPSTHKQIGHNWNHAITTMWLPDDDEVAFQLGTGSEHDLSPEGPGHVKITEFFFNTRYLDCLPTTPQMMHCESTLKLTMNWPTRNCVLICKISIQNRITFWIVSLKAGQLIRNMPMALQLPIGTPCQRKR